MMMKDFIIKNYSLLILLSLSMSCQKNDDRGPMEITLQNEPPLSFNLLEVPDGATDVNVMPTLSWESAKNPNGGEVTYDLYLGKEINPSNLLQANITETTFEVPDRLNLLSDYYWKVVATDTEGQTSQSSINSFTTRNFALSEEPEVFGEFPARWGHTSVLFDQKLWVIGGSYTNFSNDIWQSSDGVTWEQIDAQNHFSERRSHASVVFNNKIWVIAGQTDFNEVSKSNHLTNDIWYSENGTDWVQVTEPVPFSERHSHTITVFNNAMWLIGGANEGGFDNDVWHSSDGINWTEVTANAPFSVRSSHTATVFDNKLWVIGGNNYTDVDGAWYTEDGENWTKATAPPGFSGRRSHTSTVFDNRLWVIGGRAAFGTLFKTIWFTEDGENWQELDKTVAFLPRTQHTTTVFNDKIFTIAGVENSESSSIVTSEIWVIE